MRAPRGAQGPSPLQRDALSCNQRAPAQQGALHDLRRVAITAAERAAAWRNVDCVMELVKNEGDRDCERALDFLRAEVVRLQQRGDAVTHSLVDVEQTLGKALGYPWFRDDQKNFPGATAADGVCVGEHVPESLAAEAATWLRRMTAALQIITRRHEGCTARDCDVTDFLVIEVARAALSAESPTPEPTS